MPEFSIIIPVYNAEKTLYRCLDSIKNQSFDNYEVILIDDGSTDNSLQICNTYSINDDRFVVIHQKNSGPSAARNNGLNVATGIWISFVDSDDFVEPTYLQELYTAVHSSEIDVVFFGYNKIQNNNKEAVLPCDIAINNIETYINLSEIDMFGYTWIKSFRNDVINDIRFDSHLNLFEDEVFTCQVLQNCQNVSILKKSIYNYNIGDGTTLIGRTHSDYCIKCDKVYSAWKTLLKDSNYENYISKNKANTFVSRCYFYAFERKVALKKYFSQLKETAFFQDHTKVFKLDSYVNSNNFIKIYYEKFKYQLKVYISKIFI